MNMGCYVIGYIVVLAIDVIVGAGVIFWKCVLKEDESECRLATAGTLGSVGIWLVLLFVCPFCMTKVDCTEIFLNLKDRILRTRPRQYREISVQNDIYLPTTLSFQGKGQKVVARDQDNISQHRHDNEKPIQHLMLSGDQSINSCHPDIVYTYSEEKGSLVRVPLLKYISQDEPSP